MPTYDYVCKSCGHQWELMQSITSQPARTCPKCHKKMAQRQIGTGAAILVGGSGASQPESGGHSGASKVAHAGEQKTPAANPTKKPTAETVAGTGAHVEGKKVGAPASAAPPVHEPGASGTSGATEEPSNATHPAREGRGFGNIKDAIARQRKDQNRGPGGSGSGYSGKGPGQGGGKNFGAPRKGGSRGR